MVRYPQYFFIFYIYGTHRLDPRDLGPVKTKSSYFRWFLLLIVWMILSLKVIESFKQKRYRPWQDSNLQSPAPETGAFSIRPHGLMLVTPVIPQYLSDNFAIFCEILSYLVMTHCVTNVVLTTIITIALISKY